MEKYWLKEPEDHDYPAALDYLELIYILPKAKQLMAKLKKAKTTYKKAKDILRAAELPLLPADNIHVKRISRKLKPGNYYHPSYWYGTFRN